MNRLLQLESHGQSIWFDFIKRDFLRNGDLKKLIDDVGLKGVTSNPAIFEKAIGQGTDYDAEIERLSKAEGSTAISIYEQLAIEDIQEAADILFSVYEKTNRADGYVSLEVSPTLANDEKATVEEGKRLWKAVCRPNLMIKVPATDSGINAVRTLISEGINVNVTLLFSKSYYEKIAYAYIAGLKDRLSQSKAIDHIHSVASFFISRIDSLVDQKLAEKSKTVPTEHREKLDALLGKTAIANAKLTFQLSKQIYASQKWQEISKHSGNIQRLLWASTSTKNPAFRDVMYVEELVGPNTVNTLPPATLEAFADHGEVRDSLEDDLASSNETMDALKQENLDFEALSEQLTQEGVQLFADAFVKLLATIEDKRLRLTTGRGNNNA